jgi:hypothetical protein
MRALSKTFSSTAGEDRNFQTEIDTKAITSKVYRMAQGSMFGKTAPLMKANLFKD